MASLNKMILIGTVGKDPEVRHAPSGRAMLNITVATTETWKDKPSGLQKASTEWHRVVFYGELAETAGQIIRSGMEIYVEGRLKTRKYERDGEQKTSTEIEAYAMQPTGTSNGGTSPHANKSPPTATLKTSPAPVSAWETEAIY